jgi:ABC-type antimicrobial peptide transport system permease subunit
MPSSFKFLFEDDPQIFVPIGLTANTREKQDRGKHDGVYAIARLKPGVTLAQAQSDLDLISARLAKAYPDIDYLQQGRATSLSEETIGGEREWILILVSAVALVLLIACANVANLLLAKASGRQSEMAIRLSLGATRTRLFRQMLTESILLALGGGILGLLVASGGVHALLWVAREDFIRTEQIHLNPTVVAFTFHFSRINAHRSGLWIDTSTTHFSFPRSVADRSP